MRDWLEAGAEDHPAAPCLVDGGRELTYGDLDGQVARAVGVLRKVGIEPGDRVAVWGGNDRATVRALLAVPRAGAVLVPLNRRLAPPEAGRQVQDAAVSLVVGSPDRPELGVRSLDLSALEEGDPAASNEVIAHAPHSIFYTSGTSAEPKGVILTWANHEASAAASAAVLDHHAGDRWLLVLPLHHVGGMAILTRSFRQGGSVALQHSFDPAGLAARLRAGDVTLVSLVATMLGRLLEVDPGPYPGLRAVLVGGGPVPEAMLARAAGRVPVLPTYGLTETASQVATLPLTEAFRPQRAAKAVPGAEVRVVGDDGRLAAPDSTGTIEVRGPMVSPGYLHGSPREYGSWLTTGDLGTLDGDGYLRVAGRRDDTIVTGGENVHPQEVEAVLESHPGVREAAVFGVADPDWGAVVSAAVVGEGVSAASLDEFLRPRLAGYKIPRRWRFVSELPRTNLGKIERRLLAQEDARRG